MTKIGNWISLLFLNLFVIAALGAVTVQSTVDRNEMGLGDTLTLTVSAASPDSVEASEPRVPPLDGFELVNAWTSSSTSSKLVQTDHGMEFQSVHRQDFNYMLSSQRQGNLTIPSFEVVADGKTYHTQSIVIKVSPQGSGAAQRPRGQAIPDEAQAVAHADPGEVEQAHDSGTRRSRSSGRALGFNSIT